MSVVVSISILYIYQSINNIGMLAIFFGSKDKCTYHLRLAVWEKEMKIDHERENEKNGRNTRNEERGIQIYTKQRGKNIRNEIIELSKHNKADKINKRLF